MKPIELTQRQVDRIIILCTVLYPNRHWIWFADENGLPNGMIGHARVSNPTTGKRYPATKIHWLECMVFNILPKFVKKYDIKINVQIPDLMADDINLIDLVYRKFKKLEK